jgi:hypothetical protein
MPQFRVMVMRSKEGWFMAKHLTRRQREWSDGHERYVRLVQQLSTSCDTCSAVLARTHDYVFYGSVCPGCWSQQEPLVGLMASHERGTGGG